MRRSKNRIIKLSLRHLEKRLWQIEKRMRKLLIEYNATEQAIKYFLEQNPGEAAKRQQEIEALKEKQNALSSGGSESGITDGAPAGEGAGGLELPVQPSLPEALAQAGESAVQDNPSSKEVGA